MRQVENDNLAIDKALLGKFNLRLLKKHCALPISLESGNLKIALGNPYDFAALTFISSFHTGKTQIITLPPEEINMYLNKEEALGENSILSKLSKNAENHFFPAEPSPAAAMLDGIIKTALALEASDIHIEPLGGEVRVRYRIDGVLTEKARFSEEIYPSISARLKIISGMNIAEKRLPQDGRINAADAGFDKNLFDFRVSAMPTVNGEKFAIRILDKTMFYKSRKELGFTKPASEIADKMISRPYGIILLAGPTGCGKTTTLYNFLKEVNKPGVNIVTVEDPVEYLVPGINQIQVNAKTNLNFANTLRSVIRQDPDIIMIGEIRDEETAKIAIRAAIMGRLVFSTIHTNDAPGAWARLADMGVLNYLLAESLIGVISQRLVKKLCPNCKTKHRATSAELAVLGESSPAYVWRPNGCVSCGNSGYKGRVAVYEIMQINDKIREAMMSFTSSPPHGAAPAVTAEKLRETAKENGMTPLWEVCKSYVIGGITSPSELMALYME
ncbi:MAG: GspE/PulE family protein [Eubacteriales bacterium]